MFGSVAPFGAQAACMGGGPSSVFGAHQQHQQQQLQPAAADFDTGMDCLFGGAAPVQPMPLAMPMMTPSPFRGAGGPAAHGDSEFVGKLC